MSNDRPLPLIDDDNRAFWTGGAEGELRIYRCDQCRQYLHPPLPMCRHCGSRDVTPEVVSGNGTVASFTVNHMQWQAGLKVPYVIGLVELDEQAGLRITAEVQTDQPDTIYIGQEVRVEFEAEADVFVPYFVPVGQQL